MSTFPSPGHDATLIACPFCAQSGVRGPAGCPCGACKGDGVLPESELRDLANEVLDRYDDGYAVNPHTLEVALEWR